MAELNTIVSYLSETLRIADFPDSSLNGLQIEGKSEVNTVAVAVDAGASVIEEAISRNADLLVVHHGLFWSKPMPIVGAFKKSIKQIVDAGLSIYAAHLPLDAHENWGNNFTLGRMLQLDSLSPSFPYHGVSIGCRGKNRGELSLTEFVKLLQSLPGATATMQLLAFGPKIPKIVGIVSGSGAEALYTMQELGVDTLISGEGKQFAYHYAKDNNLNVIFAGHYATETVGVIEVGNALNAHFGIQNIFIDQPTGF